MVSRTEDSINNWLFGGNASEEDPGGQQYQTHVWGPGQPGHTWDPGLTATVAGSTGFQEKP